MNEEIEKDVLGEIPVGLEGKQKETGGLPGFENLDPEEQNKQLQKMFREVFNTQHGRIVLGVILEDLYYFSTCNNDEARALNNYAKALISQRLGIIDHKKQIDRLLAD